MKMFTRGGAISGNCATGDVLIANSPMKTMATDKAMARTGLLINLLNIAILFFGSCSIQHVNFLTQIIPFQKKQTHILSSRCSSPFLNLLQEFYRWR